jgi:competence protein ComEA
MSLRGKRADERPSGGRAGRCQYGDECGTRTASGVGPKIAAAIVEHRSANGPFRSVEDLLLVKGIGPKKLEALRNSIVVR